MALVPLQVGQAMDLFSADISFEQWTLLHSVTKSHFTVIKFIDWISVLIQEVQTLDKRYSAASQN